MEGKRAAALCCLLIVLMSGQQQVAAMSQFCECYKTCYPECRNHLPTWMCEPKCMDDCSSNESVVAPTSAGDCDRFCWPLSVCGTTASGPADDEGCVDDCIKNLGAYAPTTSNLN
ncbi:hypothetical protein EJB05_28456 [Eragrostis curvula]|uniref:Bifunctional inhibitor/plant lipid transfer protein/seed storage helical domain-containing protein n=1 Tax=Eragrostis curvula TaxID=38414 RepID=A0A5J9UQZ7_9POAL|nr:hypothetical protein EJB05_28456 [Eragrostis curvula]